MQFAIHDSIVNCILECSLQFKILYSVYVYQGCENIRGEAQEANYHPCKNIFSCFGDQVPPSSCLLSSVKQFYPYGCYIDFPFGGMTAILEFRSDTSKKAVV